MISAVDTNILLDVFLPDKRFAEQSANLLKRAYDEGALLICDIVYAELAPQFNDRDTLDNALNILNISISPSSPEVAFLAGERWGLYRKAGGTRRRIITGFLIGAHAAVKAERFLTRDRGLYKSCFKELVILS